MTKVNSIAAKIAKVIALADSTTHPEEAESFMAKAHAMMTEHGLNLMDLGRLSEDPVGADEDAWGHAKSYSFMPKVASAAAKYYGVDWVRMQVGNRVVYTVAGRQSARTTFMLMMPYLEREVMRVGRELYNAGGYNSRMQSVTRAGNALAVRIWGMVKEANVRQHHGTGANALVPIDLNKQILDDMFPDARQPRGSKIKTDKAAKEAVKGINLSAQTTGKTVKKLGAR